MNSEPTLICPTTAHAQRGRSNSKRRSRCCECVAETEGGLSGSSTSGGKGLTERRTKPLSEPLATGERFGLAVISSLLIPLSISALVTVHESPLSRPVDPWQQRFVDIAFRFFLSELLVAFSVFCVIAFIHATLMPRWSGRAIAYLGRHVWQALLVFGASCMALGIAIAVIAMTSAAS